MKGEDGPEIGWNLKYHAEFDKNDGLEKDRAEVDVKEEDGSEIG